MNDFRCQSCHNLLFKYKLLGNKVLIQTKCYKDNTFNNFTIYLPIKNNEKNNKQKSKWTSIS